MPAEGREQALNGRPLLHARWHSRPCPF